MRNRTFARGQAGSVRTTLRLPVAAVASVVFFLATPVVGQPQPPPRQNTVDLSVEYQTIDNFGASDCWSMQKIGAWSQQNKDRIADLLFSRTEGIGLSLWRFNLGAGVNHQTIANPWRTVETFETGPGQYDWTRQTNEQWFLQAAKARGVPQFLAFVNSPPGSMTANGLTNGTVGGTGTTNLASTEVDEFATYMVDVLKHFRDNPDPAGRIPFDYISPFNEPQWEWNGPGCNQEGNRADNATIKALYTALDTELSLQGVTAEIAGVESGSLPAMYQQDANYTTMMNKYSAAYGDYIQDFCTDTQMAAAMGKRISYHSYWSDDPDTELIQDRQALRQKMDQVADDWKIWQSEYCVMEGGRDLTMTTALRVARVIHFDLTVVDASAWHWWTAVSPENYKDGLIYTNYRNPGDPETIYPSKTLWTFGNFSRFIRPGMVRVALVGGDSEVDGLLASAYTDPDTGELAIVYINQSPTSQQVLLTVEGLAAGEYLSPVTLWITSDEYGDDLRPSGPIEPGGLLTIPALSVITVTGQVMPEPATLTLLAVGGLAVLRRRKGLRM